MNWGSFFPSEACRRVTAGALISLTTGATVSAIVAWRVSNLCTSAVDSIIRCMGNSVLIPTFSSEITFSLDDRNITVPVTFSETHLPLPHNWIHALAETQEMPAYCFAITLTLGLGFTAIATIAIANSIALTMFSRGQNRVAASAINSSTESQALLRG